VHYILDSSSSDAAFISPQSNNCQNIEIPEIFAGDWTKFPHFLQQTKPIHCLKLGFTDCLLRQMPSVLWMHHDFLTYLTIIIQAIDPSSFTIGFSLHVWQQARLLSEESNLIH